MLRILFTIYCFLLFAGSQVVSSVEPEGPQTKETQKQRKHVPQPANEVIKPDEHYITAEVKGTIRYEVNRGAFSDPGWAGWTITAGKFKWELDFGNNKQLLKIAEEHKGKTVVVTGRVGSRGGSFYTYSGFGEITVLHVATCKAPEK